MIHITFKIIFHGTTGKCFDRTLGRSCLSTPFVTIYNIRITWRCVHLRQVILPEGMERFYCLLVTDFLLLSQLFVIPCAFIIILDAVDKLLCINTIISQENFIVTRALNIILDAIDIISRMHTVI